MKTKADLKVLSKAIDILDANKINVDKVLIKISFGKKIEFLLNDDYLKVDPAFKQLKRYFPKTDWKTRHNKIPIYKITIKA